MLRSSRRPACIFHRIRTFTTNSPPVGHDPSNIAGKLRVLCTCGRLEEAFSLFYTLVNVYPSSQLYASLFHACATRNRLDIGQALHHFMLSNTPNSTPNLYLTNHLINMYGKCGLLEVAHQLFDQMPHRNIVSWTALISGYAQHGRPSECFSLFSKMLAHCRPTEYAYASLLVKCDIDCGRQVHALTLKTSFDEYVYVANALITMYSNGSDYGVAYDDNKDEVWMVFKGMEFRNLVTWNSMIAGFQSRGLAAQAVKFFSMMHHDAVGFGRATLLSVFSSLCSKSEFDVASSLEYCFLLHGLVLKTALLVDNEVATALVKAYSTLGGEVADCYSIFLETKSCRDIVSWTNIIAAFAETEAEKAFSLFCQFNKEGLGQDSTSLSVVLKACAGLVTQLSASSVHSLNIRYGFQNDVVVSNALIHAYARCGSIYAAKQVFDKMDFRNIVSWNSMLKAFALHGQAKEAVDLFGQMTVHPDGNTFIALLSACSHSGMVREGTKIFESMIENYGITPQIDHFACMVDILGRAGHIDEAHRLITTMPIEPDSVVWSAFLGACRKHGETSLANLAAGKMKDLDPENSLGYVLMSNIYSSSGTFSEAGLIRKEMKGIGVQKEPGLSWVEVGSEVHEFASGGQRHSQGEAIRAYLEQLVGKLKGLGYVPETSVTLHDVEEEQKEEHLYHHSEKLALAFALMNAGSLHCNRGVIQIMKNIRICVDCHNFMKVASELFSGEIVVRDSNRFHHFKGRVCSCNDYW